MLYEMVRAIQENKDYLGEIDGLIGDGDHGMNMNKGFTLFWEKIRAEETGFSEGLNTLGATLFNKIGGSMGPIYGTLFMSMADGEKEADEIDLVLFTEMLRKSLDELCEIVDARPGDKTLVDTLYPAVQALENARDKNKTFSEALIDMKSAATSGKDSTKDMIARFGRSSRLGERSRGVLDAGAVSCCIILTAMADGILHIIG